MLAGFLIVSGLKSIKVFDKIRTAFNEINPQHLRFRVESSKDYVQEFWGATTREFLHGIWFDTQRKDGANTTSLKSPQKKLLQL